MYPPTLSVNEGIYLLHAIEIATSRAQERSIIAKVVRGMRLCLLHHLASSVAYVELLHETRLHTCIGVESSSSAALDVESEGQL